MRPVTISECEAVDERSPSAQPARRLRNLTDHAERIDLEREQLELLNASGLPIITLPALPQGADSGSIRELADLFSEQGMAR